MTTEKLYENDSYITTFQATVLACVPAEQVCAGQNGTKGGWADESRGQWAICLDRTAFFPEGGGQGADTGWLDESPVWDVQIIDGALWHRTDLEAKEGQALQGRIDWQRRFSNMQQHSGEHIFSGLTHRHFGYDNVGFHLGSQVVTMDFNGTLTQEDLDRIEWEVNEAIVKNVPISVSYPDRERLAAMEYRSKIEIDGQVRIITVEGYDVCACCAPHVARTGEIGLLKVVDHIKYKGGTRVSMLCGFRALTDYREKLGAARQISRALSVPAGEIAPAVEGKLEENARLRQKNVELTGRLIEQEVAQIPCGQENVWYFKEGLEAAAMRRAVNLALERVEKCAGVFCGDDKEGYKYIIGTRSGCGRELAKILKEKLEARGGGSPEMIQGFVAAGKSQIEAVLREAAGNI